jgi:glycosyltransferase involved in cell wall biosynthesis
MSKRLIMYHTNIIEIGGVETLTYNWCEQLCKYYDITLIYKTCHIMQLYRLSHLVKCEVYDPNKTYTADICVMNCSWGGYPEAIKAKEYWQMIHANYKELLATGYIYKGWSKTTRHIAVSNTVAKVFEEIYHIKCDVIYNILGELKKTRPILKLISATRLSSEKGYHRMIKLATLLRDAGIKFRWYVFCNPEAYGVVPVQIEGIIYMRPSYDIFDYIAEADYGVQLSDTEGYSFFVNECLQYGTAMLCTNFDSVHESMVDGVQGYILPMSMENIDLERIVNKIPKGFEYTPKTTRETWTDYIGDPEYKIRKVTPVEKPVINTVQTDKPTRLIIKNLNKIRDRR